MKTLTITKNNFLEWYFESGQDDMKKELNFRLANRVIEDLYMFGKSEMKVENLFEEGNHDFIKLLYIDGFKEDDDRTIEDLNIEYTLELID